MKAIRIHQCGGPEVMRYEEVPDPSPGPGQALVDMQAVGVNFRDVYVRTGLYPPTLPTTLGREGAGVISAIGEGVTEVAVGDLVAWSGVDGSYAQRAVVPADKLVKIPPGVDARTGASIMVQGLTAHYLAHSTYPLKKGDTCLAHAGAGGTGLLLIQMAKRLGATVITTVSTEAKADLARGAGADVVINYIEQDFQSETMKATGGRGVQVVYDSVGDTTFDKSLASLAPRGMLALFGQSSGPVPPVDPAILNSRSLYLTRPNLGNYTDSREELLWRTNEVLGWVRSGELKLRIGHEFPLSEAAEAHRQLEGRGTTGKILLMP